jgi:23S rRNA (uracil1939-C5)-methyltransferase
VVYAQAIDVLSPSPDRRSSRDSSCGGQVYAHIEYSRQLQLKGDIIVDAFARLARLPLPSPPPILGSPERGYRMRARLHVHASRIGFYREGTHELCDAASTGQLSDATTAWLSRAERTLHERRLTGLTGLELAENIPGDQRACHLELFPGVDPGPFEPLAADLAGLSAGVGEAGPPVRLAGVPVVSDILHVRDGDGSSALRLRRQAHAFFQSNRFLLEPLVRHVVALAPPGPVVDLYAGVGLFGLSLAASGCEHVTLVEGDPIAGSDLAGNAEPFGDRVRVEARSVESFLARGPAHHDRPTSRAGPGARARRRPARAPSASAAWILDPPRTGLSRPALAGLLASRPPRVIYVSCDMATLARDVRAMTEAGYGLQAITGIDLFPNTAHVEAVAVLDAR